MTTQVKTRTYQGGTLEELLPRIREELGDDAVVVRQREGLVGGVGGFFQRRCVEVEARAADATTAAGRVSVTDGPDAMPDPAAPDTPAPGASVAQAMLAQASAGGFGARLADAQREQAAIGADPGPAPSATVGAAVSVDELLAGASGPGSAAVARPEAPPVAEPAEAPPAARQPAAEPPRGRVVVSPQVDALPPREPASPAEPPPAEPPRDREADRSARARRVIATLVDRGLSEALAQELVDGVMAYRMPLQPGARPGALVARELAARIPAAPLRRPGATAWVGTGGAGKTSVVAAFARAHAEAGTLPVAVVALHPADDGAALRTALEGVAADVHVAADDAVAEPLVRWLVASGRTVVLDTPAISPRQVAEVRALGRRLHALGVDDVHLCVPATLGARVAHDLLEAAAPLKPTALTVTHADETERLGAAVQLAVDSGLPVSYVSEAGPAGRGLRAGDPVELAKRLIG